ncbi:MAG: glycosyltransferase [Synergistaceae bacterium]|jgi:glycosyltransferase involved in cell wall biosynthesis|nr:glycosyltransferase [Synergistaceae bacterium]
MYKKHETHEGPPCRVTVVTVCLNAESTLETALRSVLDQSRAGVDVEYIVIDGGSTDGTLRIIEKYADRLAHIISEPDRGIYDAFNKGIRLATGDVIGLLNADDLYAPWAFRTVAELARRPDCGVFYGKQVILDREFRRWTVYSLGDFRQLPEHMNVAHPTVFVRKGVYERHGLFDVGYGIAGDWDLMLRLYRGGERFCPVDKVLAAFDNAGVSSIPSRRLLRENRKVYFRHMDFLPAAWRTAKMELRYCGRKILDVSRAYRLYGRWRDKKLLQVEASGTYDSVGDIWESLARDADAVQ